MSGDGSRNESGKDAATIQALQNLRETEHWFYFSERWISMSCTTDNEKWVAQHRALAGKESCMDRTFCGLLVIARRTPSTGERIWQNEQHVMGALGLAKSVH